MRDDDFEDEQDFSGDLSDEALFQVTDNIIQSFQLETSNLRGRIVRFGSVIDDILTAHKYPEAISHLVGETMTLTALLSSMLKYEGIFTLQTSGDGPVRMLVADMTSGGDIRGCAGFDQERLQNVVDPISAFTGDLDEGSQNYLAQLLGKGYIAFTVDQGNNVDRYQGIVELKGASLVDCVQHYFTQSEQIGTGIKMAVGIRDGQWRSAGIMLQQMPEQRYVGEAAFSNIHEDDWRRAMVLLDSCTDDELLDPALGHNMLLTRLFHEEGVRVFPVVSVKNKCRCSEEKVENVLFSLGEDDREEITVDNVISMVCEFCSRHFTFDPAEITRKINDMKRSRVPK